MHILQKPFGRNLTPDPGLARARQHFASDGGEL
jgi:hypothetical protein